MYAADPDTGFPDSPLTACRRGTVRSLMARCLYPPADHPSRSKIDPLPQPYTSPPKYQVWLCGSQSFGPLVYIRFMPQEREMNSLYFEDDVAPIGKYQIFSRDDGLEEWTTA